MNYVLFASYGNDSVALIQWAHEQGLQGLHVAYSDTGWAAPWWGDRLAAGEAWAQSLGFATHRIGSEGMHGLVRRKKAWPRGGGGKFQFCTEALKERPAVEVYGITGGQPGWTETYGWLHRGKWEQDFAALVEKRRTEIAGQEAARAQQRADAESSEARRKAALLQAY